jgi:hypothetical protein
MFEKYFTNYHHIIKKFRAPHRLVNCIEELAELQKAITKQLRFYFINNYFSDDLRIFVIEEIVDVYITIEETKIIFKITDIEIEEIIKEKMDRGVI